MAVKEIERKLGIKRMRGNLSADDAETYTADSTGLAVAAFKKDAIAGDKKENIISLTSI